MGIIYLQFDSSTNNIEVIAQGGFSAMRSFFLASKALLLSLASMLFATVHFDILDETAWNEYQEQGIAYLERPKNAIKELDLI